MKGTHKVVVTYGKVTFELYIKHKFSVFIDYSGTGKTALCEYIGKGRDDVESGDVVIKTDLNPFSIDSIYELQGALGQGFNLIFIDETVVDRTFNGGASTYFGGIVKGSDAYFVFMSRRKVSFPFAPINVDACYRLVWEKHKNFTKVRMDNLYEWHDDAPMSPDTLVIEDSKVGYMFYAETLKGEHKFVSAHGNSNVVKVAESILESGAKSIFIIADGCGFGVYFDSLLRFRDYAKRQYNTDVRLFIPPSFEYLVLKSKIFKYDEDRLVNTQDYAKIEDYMGWEAFYTDELVDASKGSYRKNGTTLPAFLRNKRNSDKVYDAIHEIKR